MDRDSLRRLRVQPGYLRFVSAATLARVSDEMFSVGVVLLVLDRTGSAELAGLAVAGITLPSLLTGPLFGAWLDLTGRRRPASCGSSAASRRTGSCSWATPFSAC